MRMPGRARFTVTRWLASVVIVAAIATGAALAQTFVGWFAYPNTYYWGSDPGNFAIGAPSSDCAPPTVHINWATDEVRLVWLCNGLQHAGGNGYFGVKKFSPNYVEPPQ